MDAYTKARIARGRIVKRGTFEVPTAFGYGTPHRDGEPILTGWHIAVPWWKRPIRRWGIGVYYPFDGRPPLVGGWTLHELYRRRANRDSRDSGGLLRGSFGDITIEI